MKNILLESTKSKFKVLEHKPKNVLKRIQGVLSDFKSNRNGRIYPRELWENVLNSDYVKEMIESHGLVGELDHPEERLEISLQNVSHVINDMWIEGDQVVGTIDILPTPSGKIVSELLDYGTDIGISSRGAGSVGPNNVVDPDYQFVTFDFVARPSCEAARLNMIVESVQPEIDTNSDDKVKNILEGYKTSLKEDIFKNYYNKPALPAPGEEELYGYDLSEVCDNVEKYFGLKNKREALNKIVEEHLDKKVIDEVMKYSNLKEDNTTSSYIDIREIVRYAEEYLTALLNSSVGITRQQDGQYMITMKNDDKTIDKWLKLHNKNSLNESESLLDKYKLNGDDKFRYMMLGRLQSDCKYVLGAAEGDTRHLWVKNDIKTHCALMRELYKSLPEEPDWVSLEDIDNYEKEMLNYASSRSEDKYDDLKEGHNQEDINMMFVDMCKDALFNELGPDWRKKSLSDIEDIVHDTVFKYNEANVQPEYEDEDFYGDEADARTIYRYILDNEIPAENKTTETRLMNESKNANSSVYWQRIFDKILVARRDLSVEEYKGLINKLFNFCKDSLREFKKDRMDEAVMSDQEVYKTVLEWYKAQIEGGKMTLNQCYELLSDKAKVSLNKMVDQSKIKESMINKTINKLIKESIELNKKNSR